MSISRGTKRNVRQVGFAAAVSLCLFGCASNEAKSIMFEAYECDLEQVELASDDAAAPPSPSWTACRVIIDEEYGKFDLQVATPGTSGSFLEPGDGWLTVFAPLGAAKSGAALADPGDTSVSIEDFRVVSAELVASNFSYEISGTLDESSGSLDLSMSLDLVLWNEGTEYQYFGSMDATGVTRSPPPPFEPTPDPSDTGTGTGTTGPNAANCQAQYPCGPGPSQRCYYCQAACLCRASNQSCAAPNNQMACNLGQCCF